MLVYIILCDWENYSNENKNGFCSVHSSVESTLKKLNNIASSYDIEIDEDTAKSMIEALEHDDATPPIFQTEAESKFDTSESYYVLAYEMD